MNKLYWRWYAMKSLCTNDKNPKYKFYGGAGVTICEKWMTFQGFIEDMGEVDNARLIRIDKSKGYSKDNCAWQPIKEKRESLNRDLPKGVMPKGNGFKAQISIKGRTKYLGQFKDAKTAHKAFLDAKK